MNKRENKKIKYINIEHTDKEHVESEYLDTEHTDTANTGTEHTDTEHTDTANTGTEHTETVNTITEHAEIEHKETRRKRKRLSLSNILIMSGVVLLLVAGGLFVYNRVYDYRAGLRAQELLDQMMMDVDWNLPPISEMVYTPRPPSANTDNQDTAPPSSDFAEENIEQAAGDPSDDLEEEPEESENTSRSSVEWVAPSYTTIGIISIPKLNVRLPVISESSDYLLGISCCRISGGYDPKPHRLVIAGHNIWSHFKGLDTFEPGDQIAFTDRDGETYFYSAVENVALYKTAGAEVLAATGWDITLITCKTDNTWRTVVRFAEITE